MHFELDDFDVRARFSDVEEKNEELKRLLADGGPEISKVFENRCAVAYLYHDNALDGVVLTQHEIRAATDNSVMSDSALIPAYQEIRNQAKLLKKIESRAQWDFQQGAIKPVITSQDIVESHIALTQGIPRKDPGKLREEMPLHRLYFHQLHEPSMIEPALKTLAGHIESADFRSQHPLNQASLFHAHFMEIFPFPKLSGRIGRMWMNYFLMGAGYMPAVIHGTDRQQYFNALSKGAEGVRGLLLTSLEAGLDAALRHVEQQVDRRNISARQRIASY